MWRSRLKLIRLLAVVLGVGWVEGQVSGNTSTSGKSAIVRDIAKYPVCVTDDDCDNICKEHNKLCLAHFRESNFVH